MKTINKVTTVRELAQLYPELYSYNYKFRNTDTPELEKDIADVLSERGYMLKNLDDAGIYNDIKGYLNCEIVSIY